MAIALLATGFAQPARAAVLCVAPSGSVPPGQAKKLGCSPTIYTQIGAAVGAASADDTLMVLKGVYNEMVTIPSSLTGLSLISVSGSAKTIIDGTGLQNGIFDQASGVTINGFTIRNAEHEGILVQGPAASCSGSCTATAAE
ncbi:MAG: hypothetical protein ABSD31_17145, partial [Candidatus Binataceae bacterium]